VAIPFSWMGCMYARAKEGDNAADMLKKFATNFVSPNSFHLNGDQKGGQYSDFTYRPFTLKEILHLHRAYMKYFYKVIKDLLRSFRWLQKIGTIFHLKH
jgi:hypothetical protein